MDLSDIRKSAKFPAKGIPLRDPEGPGDKPQAPSYVAKFDSGWGMLKALSNCLKNRDFPGLGALPGAKPVELVVSKLDQRLGQRLYSWAGWSETVAHEAVGSVVAEDISRAVVSQYPQDSYPAIFIGSANGAMIHLCAAMRAPWLPQSFLVPLRRPAMDPDDIPADMEWGRSPGATLLKRNPELVLTHMHDPDHDRLMVQRMAYFRIKRRWLGETYSQFIEEKLEPGGTIYLIECDFAWPTAQLADRHFFQLGGAGGVPPDEYLHGSQRVAGFLSRQKSSVRQWKAPTVDGMTPEGEWGFEPELEKHVISLAKSKGMRLVRVSFESPEDLSPLVADFHRWWYGRRGMTTDHLLAESFAFLEPYWTLRTGSVPFWMLFNGKSSAERLRAYLSSAEPFDYIYMMLLSNGMKPIEDISIDVWKNVLAQATVQGEFIGVDETRFPYDFASFLRYNAELKNKIADRYPMPEPAPVQELEAFLVEGGERYAVTFENLTSG